MTLFQAILSGIIQGLTEFLPVSSSGHLVLLQHFMNVKETQLTFNVFLHIGTLFAVLIVFFEEIKKLFTSERKTAFLLIIAMLPAGITALLWRVKIKAAFKNPLLAAIFLVITGIILIAASMRQNLTTIKKDKVNCWQALLIGGAQALALLPGISRSGMTISAGLLSGIKQEKVVTFSFLLSILAISSAAVFEILKQPALFKALNPGILAAGVLTSFAFGLLGLKIVINIVKRKKLHYFGLYCIGAGLLVIILLNT
ncbi:MAG: undecaprenyl-diphosphate phosphatase [Candidatus Omnitrophica bacterium]|nr:undecaprenyl-diphosphate phosphatase [Candidatus Omnitrophota bacterium]